MSLRTVSRVLLKHLNTQKQFSNTIKLSSLGSQTLVRHCSDKTNTDNKLQVYFGNLSRQIKNVKIFSLMTSVAGLAAQPIIYLELSKLQSVPLLVVGCSFVGFFTFATPILLHFVTKKYVIKLDYDRVNGSYIATTYNVLCMEKKLEFKPDDVYVPDVPGMFTTLFAKKKALFLEASAFDDPTHYAKIMGYDKPMDFKLYTAPPDEVTKK
ncbi:PREDICTED: transmembrane protein 70 homolog, mitochondrial [Nicrophorus vespilloides]|uniref:Transmembrane protein 70 homolog, mitochondrial n=1 Tax=Nicrophorus vespilloides TaxID=110193 RepID=A0ABM1MKN1_NICVS|nr:PREDICTED: transmembrane protein 70 homolog, mitochondrial [Nicrophorus vespilloides]